MVIKLHTTGSPVSRFERNKINENWQTIITGLSRLQTQINILAGGEVDELLKRLDEAVEGANQAVKEAIDANNLATQEAIRENNTATQNAITENKDALQLALRTITEKLNELNTAINNAETATTATTDAKNAALQATQDAKNAINTMQSLIDNFGPKGTWSPITQYHQNNLAEVDGRTYIALKDNINTPVTDKTKWALFADKGVTGAIGPQGLPGKDGKDGTGVTIIGSLPSEDELPLSGNMGDAYLIVGFLYVWNGTVWENVGKIQGPEGKSAYIIAVENGFEGTMEEWIESLKGETGPQGPEGPPGKDADLTEVTEQLDELKPKVDNSWQRNKENNVTISNMGDRTAEKVLMINQSDWKNTGNVEQIDIGIPVEGNFSGLIKVTYTSYWGGSDSHGGATVVYRIGNYLAPTSVAPLNDYVIETITPNFAKDFYINKAVANSENGNIALLINRSPAASNPLIIKIELQGYNSGSKKAFQILNSVVVGTTDLGSTTAGGYPWVPQRSEVGDKRNVVLPNTTIDVDPNTSLFPEFLTAHANVQSDGSTGYWFVEQTWWSVSSNRTQTARTYNQAQPDIKVRHFYNGAWSAWSPSFQSLKFSASDVKTNVAAAITEQGITTSPTATGAQMAANIRAIPKGVPYYTGTVQSSSTSTQFTYSDGASYTSLPRVSITFGFKPQIVEVWAIDGTNVWGYVYTAENVNGVPNTTRMAFYTKASVNTITYNLRTPISNSGNSWTLDMPVHNASVYHLVRAFGTV